GAHGGRPPLGHGRGATRAAFGRSHGGRPESEDPGADSRRFAGVAYLRYAIACRVFPGGECADTGGYLRSARAVGGLPPPRTRDSDGSGRGTERYPESG